MPPRRAPAAGKRCPLDGNPFPCQLRPHRLGFRLLGKGASHLVENVLSGIRGEGWHVGVNDRIDDDGAITGQRPVPGRADILGPVDHDPGQPEQLGVTGVGDVGQILGRCKSWLARHRALLPGHVTKVAVVENEHDQPRIRPLPPVLGNRHQLRQAAHLHRAVPNHRQRHAIRIGELGGDSVWDATAHRGQCPRDGGEHSGPDGEIPREPDR